MTNIPSPDADDDFNEIYKEYTGPPVASVATAPEKAKIKKRSIASSDEEEEPRDPNAVPTDFTSREAKVWEAKSKATERNWKKRKEEEMICKLCGESGHFTQGCPSTLGANRKSQDFFERVAAREKHVKALFTEKVIKRIESDVGCKIKMEEKFIIVSGKDRLCLAKGVDSVHKVIKEGGKGNSGGSSSQISGSRSPDGNRIVSRMGRSESQFSKSRSPDANRIGSRMGRSEKVGRQERVVEDHLVEPQRSNPSPRSSSQYQQRLGRQEKVVEDRVREDLQQLARGTSQAYGSEGARGRSSLSKSPARSGFSRNAFNPYEDRSQYVGSHKPEGSWDMDKRGVDIDSGGKYDYPAIYTQTLEELELEYRKDAMELGKIRDKEEDEENYKHREAIRETTEKYMKQVAILRGMQAKQWEEFLQLQTQKREQARNQISSSTGYNHNHNRPGYMDYDPTPTSRYPYPAENYSTTTSRPPHDNYSDYGKTYNRY